MLRDHSTTALQAVLAMTDKESQVSTDDEATAGSTIETRAGKRGVGAVEGARAIGREELEFTPPCMGWLTWIVG